MGLKRMLWRSTGIGRTIDTIKNIADEGSLIEGVKRTVKEDYCEDNPITSTIYKSGKYDGRKEGYAEASDEYEKEIAELSGKVNKTEAENEYLQQLLLKDRKLRKMAW